MSSIDLFLIAGEPSADLQGAKLVAELLRSSPALRIAAVAGPQMRKLPIRTLFKMEDLQVMGFIDVLKALPRIASQFFKIRRTILELRPQAVISIDYPGFNLRLAASLKKKGFLGKLIHYICPSVWAWGKKRIPLMEKNLDLLLTLFPFEEKCFSQTKLQVKHVGHPLVDAIAAKESPREKILAIFPGSRTHEIERNLPLQMAVAQKMQKEDPSIAIAISLSSEDKKAQIQSLAKGFSYHLTPPGEHYALMEKAHVAIATSGTVTLELALHETPTIVSYAIRPLDLFLAQKVFRIRLPFYCIVNIIGSEEIFPEFFGPNLTEEALYKATKKLWENPEAVLPGCRKVRSLLSEKKASREASKLILNTIYQKYLRIVSAFIAFDFYSFAI